MRSFRIILVLAAVLMIFSQPVVAGDPDFICFPHICG